MGRYLSSLANAALFVLCCFLLANTANRIFAAWLAPEPVDPRAESSAAVESRRDHRAILDRNLFNASLLAPAVAQVDVPEDLEATTLPLRLLGTVAAVDPARAWAAVQDTAQRKTLILRNGDPVRDGAELVRIERRRIVLLEQGRHRELALDEDRENGKRVSAAQQAQPRRTARRPRRPTRPTPTGVEEVVNNPGSLFQQAQFQPRYEDGEMVGMQINAIKPGSLFEEAGIQNGEIIVELNGIPIDGPEASAEVVSEFSEATEFTVVLEGPDGPRTLTFGPGGLR